MTSAFKPDLRHVYGYAAAEARTVKAPDAAGNPARRGEPSSGATWSADKWGHPPEDTRTGREVAV